MTREEAQQQLETFFRKLGLSTSVLNDTNFVKATVGEAVIGFEYSEAEGVLIAKALIYRFRNNPNPVLIEALIAEQKNSDTGGGNVDFATDDLSLTLEKTFVEKLADEDFYEQVNKLAQASLVWSSQILPQIAESVHGN